MGFVSRFLHVVENRFSVVKKHFEELCRRIGGRVHEDETVVQCIKHTHYIADLEDYVEDFYSFVDHWKNMITKPIQIVFENRLLGGWSEESAITYNPDDDEFSIYVGAYSEYGLEPREVQAIKGIEIEKQLDFPELGVSAYGEGDVDQNPATDEFVGVGEANISIPRTRVSGHKLKEVFRKLIDFAYDLAEKALEEKIEPSPELD